MKVIGLCGGSGSGKSTVASLFLDYGIPSLNADAIYHELTTKDTACLRELARAFGDGIILDGALDRHALAAIVFSPDGEDKRQTLNRITHRYVLEEIRGRILALCGEGVRAVVVDAPLLFESGFDSECDLTVCVVADRAVRIARLTVRDGISASEASRRMDVQLSDEELMRRCDAVIKNDGSPKLVAQQVRCFVQKYLN